MKDWAKTVIWFVICFCMISALAGIFELFAFLQQCGIQLKDMFINDKTRALFNTITPVTLVCAVAAIAMIVITVIILVKNGKNKKLIVPLLVVVLAVSIFFTAFPYLTVEILKNPQYDNFNSDKRFYYPEFTHSQQYLSATLSVFLPLLIAASTMLGYHLYNVKIQKSVQSTPNTVEGAETTSANNDGIR